MQCAANGIWHSNCSQSNGFSHAEACERPIRIPMSLFGVRVKLQNRQSRNPIVFGEIMRRIVAVSGLVAILALSLLGGRAAALDYWMPAEYPGVVTDNDCGSVSAVAGIPLARRGGNSTGETFRLHPADRLSGGDVLTAPPRGRVEMISGNNTILAVGPDSEIRLHGLRTLQDDGGREIRRLDATLIRGGCRMQVRLNTAKPEAALITTDFCDVLVTRGDVAVSVEDGWRVSVLSGEASIRSRRAGTAGSPVVVLAGSTVGDVGREELGGEQAMVIRERVPFSFETDTAALPPLPPMSHILEAP